VTEASVEAAQDDASALVLAFTLPAGAYATALLHELCGERLVTVPQTT
jgi:tRNA(Glu) U13 pseudouridine synthase TruD